MVYVRWRVGSKREERERRTKIQFMPKWLLFSQGRRLEKPSARSRGGRVWAEG